MDIQKSLFLCPVEPNQMAAMNQPVFLCFFLHYFRRIDDVFVVARLAIATSRHMGALQVLHHLLGYYYYLKSAAIIIIINY